VVPLPIASVRSAPVHNFFYSITITLYLYTALLQWRYEKAQFSHGRCYCIRDNAGRYTK
jgi:hypothetical protein